jgi:hypothetical protein
MRVALAAGVAVSVAFAAPAGAQDLAQMCDKVLDVQVGQWAEYQMSGGGMGGSGRMRLAIVGTQDVAGENAYWIEMKIAGDQGSMITQVLAGTYPYDSDQIHEMVFKMGDQPAMKVSGQMMGMMRDRMGQNPALEATEKCRDAQIVGWESITVPAGQFRALHLKPADADGDVWALEDVPFGMIKFTDGETEIVLMGHGMDATSSITETPQAMPGMGGGR